MGTLYLVTIPEGDAQDITLRAMRIVREVAFVAADPASAARLLAPLDVSTPLHDLVPAAVVEALATADVAVLHSGLAPASGSPAQAVIRAALDAGYSVVPIPGPSPALTALVISGLPADSFLFLGSLAGLDAPFGSLAAEPRTIVATESADRLAVTVDRLAEALGDRPLALAGPMHGWTAAAWRGTLGGAAAHLAAHPARGDCALVIGGSEGQAPPWDEARLQAEIQARLAHGLPAREVARQLAAESGWPRRDIYRLATQTRPAGSRNPAGRDH